MAQPQKNEEERKQPESDFVEHFQKATDALHRLRIFIDPSCAVERRSLRRKRFISKVGGALFSRLAAELLATGANKPVSDAHDGETFFREKGGPGQAPYVARAVLVDMEPKVVAATLNKARGGQWAYHDRSWYARDSGSGNNWARGYHVHGPFCKEAVLNLVRRQAEACDHFGGFLTLQSLAGGTGSGLGAYLIRELREEYPNACILSHCVWPYESGEVVVQSYNVLLSLTNLLEAADGAIVVGNESLHATCTRQLSNARPTLGALNTVAADSLAPIIMPSQKRSISGPPQGGRKMRQLADVIGAVCSAPQYRLLTLRAVPQMEVRAREFTSFSWPPLVKRLRQMLLTGSMVEDGVDWSRTATLSAPWTGQLAASH